jgi:Flp pilus assembly protein TadD
MNSGLGWRVFAVAGAVVALAVVFAYGSALDAPFTFDDTPNIVDNPLVKDVRYFLHPSEAAASEHRMMFYNRTVGYATFALNYALGGLSPRGYRAVNVAVHLAASGALLALALLLLETPSLRGSPDRRALGGAALAAAAIFALHPVNTQAVTYIVQRFSSLAALLYVTCAALYVAARLRPGTRGGRALYALALVSAALALKTKETAVTLPLALAAIEWIFFRTSSARARVASIAPFVLLLAAVPLTYVLAGEPLAGATRAGSTLSRISYLATEGRVLHTYLRLLLLPVGQTLDYGYPALSWRALPLWLPHALALGAAAAMARAARGAGREPLALAAFGVFWFYLTLAVESGPIPIRDVIFEHRLYLPGMGFWAAATALAGWLARSTRTSLRAPALVAVVVAGLMGIATYNRNVTWASEEALWEDVVAKAPAKLRGYTNLGRVQIAEGAPEKAIAVLTRGLGRGRAPEGIDRAEALNALAIAYLGTGDAEKAAEAVDEARRIEPSYYYALLTRAAAHGARGEFREALTISIEAVALRPADALAQMNVGLSLASLGDPEKAIPYYERAIALAPDYAEAHFNLGLTYVALREYDKAEGALDALTGLRSPLAPKLAAALLSGR